MEVVVVELLREIGSTLIMTVEESTAVQIPRKLEKVHIHIRKRHCPERKMVRL